VQRRLGKETRIAMMATTMALATGMEEIVVELTTTTGIAKLVSAWIAHTSSKKTSVPIK